MIFILKDTTIDVLEGHAIVANPDTPKGHVVKVPAGPGVDLATGSGLVDAFKAVILALQTSARA